MIRYDRLEKLAGFLEKLPRREFHFDRVVEKAEKARKECGAVCCAVGWTPSVFPRLVKWTKNPANDPLLDPLILCSPSGNREEYQETAVRIFGISLEDAEALFTPDIHPEDAPWNQGRILSHNATPKQVARAIRRFVAFKKIEAKLSRRFDKFLA